MLGEDPTGLHDASLHLLSDTLEVLDRVHMACGISAASSVGYLIMMAIGF
jgi:hypothetical protein